MLVHLIADYGVGDLAFAEVQQRLALHLPEATVVTTPVAPFDTLAAGFCVGELALTEGPPDRIVFHNVAPRADESDPRPANEGERLVGAELQSGVLIVGPNAGHVLSFVREEAVAIRYLDVPAAGSQFRSRDFFPAAIARVAQDRRLSGEEVAREAIPPVPDGVVAWVDGYGNLKTTWTAPPVPEGSRIQVTVGPVTVQAVASDGTFEVPEGELSFAPGSSGWRTRQGGERRFCELLLRGGNAAERLGHPAPGAHVLVEPPAE